MLREARANFVESCAAYSVVCYLLQVCYEGCQKKRDQGRYVACRLILLIQFVVQGNPGRVSILMASRPSFVCFVCVILLSGFVPYPLVAHV